MWFGRAEGLGSGRGAITRMPGTIFISYRRSESLAQARALYERLARDFAGRVFIDLEGIDYGDDFVASLQRQLIGCEAMLVLIGRRWLGGSSERAGRRAIDDPADFVRNELLAALQRNVRIVPVLLDGASLPAETDLPEPLRPLLRRQAMALDFRRFDADVGRLSHALRRILDGGMGPRRRHRRLAAAAALAAAGVFGAWAWLERGRGSEPGLVADGGKAVPAAVASAVSARVSAPAAAGARLRDCADERCPWLRILPAGRFDMGSPDAEPGRAGNEGPVREVKLPQRLAVGETEVTRRQFAAFVRATKHTAAPGCFHWSGVKDVFDGRRDWRNPGFEQTDDHPVVCVSWRDAQAYLGWLSVLTGRTYRLLSEAEWEYAARAGSTTPYSFGERLQDLCAFANLLDLTAKAQHGQFGARWSHAECTDGAVYTVPVGRFRPNAFNLYGMHGNVWEWVQDCWHDGYGGGPADAAPWEHDCTGDRRVRRGGGWRSQPQFLRSAFRAHSAPDARIDNLGFRIARDLAP